MFWWWDWWGTRRVWRTGHSWMGWTGDGGDDRRSGGGDRRIWGGSDRGTGEYFWRDVGRGCCSGAVGRIGSRWGDRAVRRGRNFERSVRRTRRDGSGRRWRRQLWSEWFWRSRRWIWYPWLWRGNSSFWKRENGIGGGRRRRWFWPSEWDDPSFENWSGKSGGNW